MKLEVESAPDEYNELVNKVARHFDRVEWSKIRKNKEKGPGLHGSCRIFSGEKRIVLVKVNVLWRKALLTFSTTNKQAFANLEQEIL